jgi:uncharacterized protein YdeI (YjbR/CyaY-like superfamily)
MTRGPTRRPIGADDERFQPADRAAWRDWLAANHATASGVWAVVYRRSTGKPTVTYEELVEEALCFGWIDSRPGTLDDERTMLRFTPRRPGSAWARSNKERVARLMADGRMTAAGLRLVEAARADGSWDVLDDVDALLVPDDLAAALAGDPVAGRWFAAQGASIKKPILYWVTSAKRPETRARRISEVLRYAAAGRNPLEWPRRPLQG